VNRVARDRLFVAGALTAGVLFRVIAYAERPSLSLDEARVALNIAGRSFMGLLRPLDYDQAAPPLFLWAEKVAVLLGGPNEYALRALPLLAGLLVPVFTYALARRLVEGSEASLATALTAVSPSLVAYSIQLKPYETDVLVCLGLLLVFTGEATRAPGPRPGRWTIVFGAMAVWASVIAPFVLAAIAVESWWGGRRASQSRLAAALLCWGVSFGVAYWWVYRPTAANPYLYWFWRERMLTPWGPDLWGKIWQILRDGMFTSFVAGVVEVGATRFAEARVIGVVLIATALAIGGIWRLAQTRPTTLRLLGALVGSVLLASAAGKYPLAPRLLLFCVPALMMVVAAGVQVAFSTNVRAPGLVLGACFGVVVLSGLVRNTTLVDDPYRDDHLRPAVAFWARERRPDEAVYVTAGALPAWTFYTTDWRRPDTTRLARMAREGSSGGVAFENGPPRGRAVRGDGADLAFPFAGGMELLGIKDGAPVTIGRWRRLPPESGWVESEAERIRAAAHPTAWVIGTFWFGRRDMLDAAVRALGGTRLEAFDVPGAVAVRYRFPAFPASTR